MIHKIATERCHEKSIYHLNMRHGNSQVGRDIFDKHIELGLKGLCRWPTISSEFIKPALRRDNKFFLLDYM
jgi:hypothetical protein